VATDVYELAVVFYAMVTGRLPWNDVADPSARLNPPRPSQLGHLLPPHLENVLCRSTRAEARPPSVSELARGMHEAPAARRPAPHQDLPPVRPPARRRAARRCRRACAGAPSPRRRADRAGRHRGGPGRDPRPGRRPARAPAAPAPTTAAAPEPDKPVSLVDPQPIWPHESPGRVA
jgi:hypothetical protein